MALYSVMEKQEIKKSLLQTNQEFKRMSGTFDSFIIIHRYINFLRLEPFTKELLNPIANRADNELEKLSKLNIDTSKLSVDLSNDKYLENIPSFQGVLHAIKKGVDSPNGPNLSDGLPMYLSQLSQIYYEIEEIKGYQNEGNNEQASQLIEGLKRRSLSLLDTSFIKGAEIEKITLGQSLDIAMEQINKYIIDEIDSAAILENNPSIGQISYDDKKFVLYIGEKAIKIKLKNEEPLDHYILKSLSESDFKDEAFYSEIIYDFFGDDDKKYRSLYSACERLNNKIFKVDSNIKEFLEYSSGRKGSCRVNPKYL